MKALISNVFQTSRLAWIQEIFSSETFKVIDLNLLYIPSDPSLPSDTYILLCVFLQLDVFPLVSQIRKQTKLKSVRSSHVELLFHMCTFIPHITNRQHWRHFRLFLLGLLVSSQLAGIWLPSPECLKLALFTRFASGTFTSVLFQVVFVSWTHAVTCLGFLPSVTPQSRYVRVCPVIKNPQWLPHHPQEEVQTHYFSTMVNSHGLSSSCHSVFLHPVLQP